MQKVCIFACGGQGTRMGADVPKQFLRLKGKTILQLSIERIVEAEPDVKIVIALPAMWKEFWKEECHRMLLHVPQSIVDGGITRFHSVRNALDKVADDSVVAVHDAVRPFVSADLVRALFDKAVECGSAVPVIPVTDTVKVLDSSLREIDGASADRSVLYGAQTPQVFRADTLKAAYKQAYSTAFTDDASIVRAAGYEVAYVPGERYNIKLTTPEDMLFAGFLL